MTRQTAILAALLAYLVGVLALGWLAKTRTRTAEGFYLGGRTLGPWVAALAANASSSSAWSLVGVSGFAYRQGLGALWLLPGCLGGFLLNWLVIAPRLRADTGRAITLTEYLAGPPGLPGRTAVVWFATALTLGSLLTYVSAQMQAAGGAFRHAFDADPTTGIAIGAAITVLYTLLGGYLAVSLTDTVQGLLMALVAIAIPAAAVVHFGGVTPFWHAISAVEVDAYTDPFGGRTGTAALGFALALGGIGLGYPGQPHAVNKYMGMAPDASMKVARTVGIGWAVILYTGMILVGWAARAAWPLAPGEHEQALFAASENLFCPLVDGLVIAAVLAAVMSTVDSQLLVCASSVTHDLTPRVGAPSHLLRIARATVLVIGGGAALAALLVPPDIFTNVLFAWAALGSAFGPLLLVRLVVGPVAPGWALTAMIAGGLGAIVAFYLPPVWSPGFADRVLSWLVSLSIAWLGALSFRRRADSARSTSGSPGSVPR